MGLFQSFSVSEETRAVAGFTLFRYITIMHVVLYQKGQHEELSLRLGRLEIAFKIGWWQTDKE